jgi:2,4-dienoyl-CoA reductase-like NADH-dependent reductase (Old Yellow Enzyme family)
MVSEWFHIFIYLLEHVMNERIRELVEQATERFGVKIWDESAGVFYTETHLKLNQEKFAELIVRECIDIVGVGGEFARRPKLVEKLQEHFGVEQ